MLVGPHFIRSSWWRFRDNQRLGALWERRLVWCVDNWTQAATAREAADRGAITLNASLLLIASHTRHSHRTFPPCTVHITSWLTWKPANDYFLIYHTVDDTHQLDITQDTENMKKNTQQSSSGQVPPYWIDVTIIYTLFFANQRQHITDMKTILQTLTRCAT